MKINLDEYKDVIKKSCEKFHWSKNWNQGGCYSFLELAEFIEALRGKGDPIDELGDVLFTIFAIADYYNIDVETAINKNIEKINKRLEEKH